jgi:hypothetical protein
MLCSLYTQDISSSQRHYYYYYHYHLLPFNIGLIFYTPSCYAHTFVSSFHYFHSAFQVLMWSLTLHGVRDSGCCECPAKTMANMETCSLLGLLTRLPPGGLYSVLNSAELAL